jgi:pilus assembly protein CpaD
MSSNRAALITRTLTAICLAASLAACATGGDKDKLAKETPPLTPTEQFPVTVTPHQDQILLAEHTDGLSAAQSAALQDLVDRWRDAGEGGIKIATPARGGEDAYRAAALIQEALMAYGVSPDKLALSDYDAGAAPHAPIVVGFTRYDAKGPECGRKWDSFTRSADNKVGNNFGCAITANMAAMIANPGDLVAPRDSDPGDAARRSTVLAKYRQGQTTSTPRDDQASGAISSVAK